jgi:hypothetical protein
MRGGRRNEAEKKSGANEMKKLVVLLALSVFQVPLAAADTSGAWTLRLDPNFTGYAQSVDCVFKQDGQKLTVTCEGGTPIIGEVNGQQVTWQFKTGPDDQLTATHTGELDARGTTITGTWHLNRDRDTDGKFTATKR